MGKTAKQRHVNVTDKVTIGNDLPFVLIAGPCALESRAHAMSMVGSLIDITKQLNIPFVFKTSYDKANRTNVNSERGVGFEKALPIFQEIKDRFECPILTDVHAEEHCAPVSRVVDILQIPAFLSRQTDLITAVANTGKTVNIKKGQFLSPTDIFNVINKIEAVGNNQILLTERGVSFGYNSLIVDPCSIPIMSLSGYPTVIDATHSVQRPGGLGNRSGGNRELAPIIARSAVANGVGAVFIETHNEPAIAHCDGPNMIPLSQMCELLKILKRLDEIAKNNPISLNNTHFD